jgi:hypothetical protein
MRSPAAGDQTTWRRLPQTAVRQEATKYQATASTFLAHDARRRHDKQDASSRPHPAVGRRRFELQGTGKVRDLGSVRRFFFWGASGDADVSLGVGRFVWAIIILDIGVRLGARSR